MSQSRHQNYTVSERILGPKRLIKERIVCKKVDSMESDQVCMKSFSEKSCNIAIL